MNYFKNEQLSITVFIFLRFMALIYFIAFASLIVQITGLVGESGILPAGKYLETTTQNMGLEKYWLFPTLCWINSSDIFLYLLCITGIIFSATLFMNILNKISLIFLWILYLSLVTVCQDFLGFQWDNLLLESGFLSIFLQPFSYKFKFLSAVKPSLIIVWLLRILLFKLMIFSGLVKLMSNDFTWHNLTALTYHYYTQPIPNPVSYFVDKFPLLFQKISCFLMFIAELVVPFCIFFTAKPRIFAAFIFILFQLIIFITGNYCFFNLLTIALCILLLNDDFIRKVFVKQVSGISLKNLSFSPITKNINFILAVIVLLFTYIQFSRVIRLNIELPLIMKNIYYISLPLRTFNSYGLFAVMTKTRPEIVIEGSNDASEWKEYSFKYKPGKLNRMPLFIAPHQPRLDWQMWFAALGAYHQNLWFINLCYRILQGSDEVLKLLDANPFPGSPPKYLRALLYDYKFTSLDELNSNGSWWKRELKGLYFPVVTLNEGKMIIYDN